MKIKRRTLTLLITWTIKIALVGSLLGLLYCYFGTQFFTITSYQIAGVDEESRNAIDFRLHELDKRKLYKLFPANKIFTYSTGAITTSVRDIVPEMATIDIRPVGLHIVKIEVTLLKPLFRVSDTQALTEDGIIFTTKYNIHKYPRITVASSTIKTVKSHGVVFTHMVLPDEGFDESFLPELSSITGKISSVIFPVETISVETTGEILCINKEGTSKVIFSKDADYKKVWSTLVSAIDTDPLKTKLLTSRDQLEYLDVRYGNKVFYRFSDMAFQNGSVTGILGNHATTTQEGLKPSSTTPQ
jgi:hypothetical protein